MIDLHAHTTASDGTFTFDGLIREANRIGLRALAITDHDTVGSAKKIKGKKSATELIPGIEISVFDQALGYSDIHVLGLFIDPAEGRLSRKLDELAKQRQMQKVETVGILRELGYKITFGDVKKKAKGVVGRPHIAKTLMEKYPDEFTSMPDVFEKLLAKGRPAYVDRLVQFPLAEATALIKGAGGLSFLAHPHLYPYDPEKLIPDFKSHGGSGVEVHYDYLRNSPAMKLTEKDNEKLIRKYHDIATGLGLLESGGSDFHGENKGQRLGDFGAPDEVLERLRAARRKPL